MSQLGFEFPRHRLEPVFDVVNEKLYQSIEGESIYCLEILLDCLRFMNGRNIKAEEKYAELSQVAAKVAKDLLKVINMELTDDNTLNNLLESALSEAKRIGMRGEVLDIAVTLKMLRDNFLTEMQNKTGGSDDEGQGLGDEFQLDFYDEDKTMNVYDEKYEGYLSLTAEELGMTSEVEPNLGFHPLCTDYLKVSNLNVNYVRKCLKEAQKFLKDEESYAYRNIFDRCYFLLCDATEEEALQSKAYNLAKNDGNIKLARVIFRYKNNLDMLFDARPEPYPQSPVLRQDLRRKSFYKPDETKILGYKHLAAKDYVEFNGTKLSHPVTKIEKTRTQTAVLFNRALYTLCESEDLSKQQFYVRHQTLTLQAKIQELFEEFVVKNGQTVNEELHDEFFLQIFRQMNRKNVQQSERSAKGVANALFVLALFSRYATPSKDLIEGYETWLLALKEKS